MTRSRPFLAALLPTLLAAALAAACGGAPAPATTVPAPAELATQSPSPAPGGPGGHAAPGATPAKPRELTTADAVIEASLAAQGGRERMARVKALRQTGTFQIPQMGMKGTMTSVAAPPHDALLVIELPGLGKMNQGVSGDVAWDLNPLTGARVITGEERAQLLRESAFNGDLIWKELYPKAELAGVESFAGQPAYKVVLTALDGDAQTRYYAKDTLLPVGIQTVARSQMGKLPVEVELSDWREVGGIKYAHRMQRKEGPQTIEVVIDKIEIDPRLDPSTFALPPEIAALPGAKGKP